MRFLKFLNPFGRLISFINYKVDRLRLNKLIDRGLKVGKNVYIIEQFDFDLVYPFLIEIGDNCRISKGVRILAHDATTFRDLGITRIAPVKILEGTFIGERAIILPGVTIGPRALIAAGSVVNRDIGEGKAAAGNPARPYGNYSDLLRKYREIAMTSTVFKKEDIENGKVTPEDIITTLQKKSVAFIRGMPQQDPYYINADIDELRTKALRVHEELSTSLSSSDSVCSQSKKDITRS